jgi:hypothetical protein
MRPHERCQDVKAGYALPDFRYHAKILGPSFRTAVLNAMVISAGETLQPAAATIWVCRSIVARNPGPLVTSAVEFRSETILEGSYAVCHTPRRQAREKSP